MADSQEDFRPDEIISIYDLRYAIYERGQRLTSRRQSGAVLAWNKFWTSRAKRITARVSDNARDALEQAAELLGATVNQFVVQTAYVEAQRVIERESFIQLSQPGARKILALLDHPPKPNKRLKNAVKIHGGHGEIHRDFQHGGRDRPVRGCQRSGSQTLISDFTGQSSNIGFAEFYQI